jgi:hypothetical protein
VAELDQGIARLFEGYASSIVNGDFIPKDHLALKEDLTPLLKLETYGLVTGVNGNLAKHIEEDSNVCCLTYNKFALIISSVANIDFYIPEYVLTDVGQQIAAILKAPDDIECAKKLAASIPKTGLLSITYGEMDSDNEGRPSLRDPVLLWSRPPTKEPKVDAQ